MTEYVQAQNASHAKNQWRDERLDSTK
jgi:hypothetical protein